MSKKIFFISGFKKTTYVVIPVTNHNKGKLKCHEEDQLHPQKIDHLKQITGLL